MFRGKPIIGIVGGIGSGKSYIADLFGQLGCAVLKSDEHVREAYERPEVKAAVRQSWGDAAIGKDGQVDRRVIAARVFGHPEDLRRLEQLIHPLVGVIRDAHMNQALAAGGVKAFIWDTPLLYEVGLDKHCDAVVFVEAPIEQRLARVKAGRGWTDADLIGREKAQMPLDKKRSLAQYTVDNTADVAFARRQVEAVLSRVLSQAECGPPK